MLVSRTLTGFSFLCLIAGLNGMARADATDVARAHLALGQGDCARAYEILEPLESVQAGEPEFDRLLGQAALQCGHTGRAVFALERILVKFPEDTGTRIKLAKAYKKLGEIQAARQELSTSLEKASSEQDRQAASKLRDDLEPKPAERSRTTAYVELGLGYDSNSNAATSSSLVDAGYIVLPGYKRQSDSFGSIGAGINHRRVLSAGTSVFAGVSGSQRFNSEHQEFNIGMLDASLGISIRNNDDTYILALRDNRAFLDQDAYRHAYGLTGQWQRIFDSSNQIILFAQALRLGYSDQSVRNADRYVGGVKYSHVFLAHMTPTLSVSAYAGTENEHASGVPYLGHRLAGARLAGDLTLTSRAALFWTAGYEHRDYGGQDPTWGFDRKDNEYRVSAGMRYAPAAMWTIKPELAYVRNNSSVEFNDYKRYVFSVTLRKDFNW